MSTTVCTTEELRQLGMAVFTAAGVAAENAAQVKSVRANLRQSPRKTTL